MVLTKFIRILLAIILLNSTSVLANKINIVVVGLFSGQAVLTINQTQRLLKVGQKSPEGVTLISANSKEAVLEFDGERKIYALGSHIASNYAAPSHTPSVNLWPVGGMYFTSGTINGHSIEFIVDTGATSIALNLETAKRLDLDFYNSTPINIETASAIVHGYPVTLDVVQVGDIKLYNVQGVVLESTEPSKALLGMSFLGQLDIKQSDQKLELKQKY